MVPADSRRSKKQAEINTEKDKKMQNKNRSMKEQSEERVQ